MSGYAVRNDGVYGWRMVNSPSDVLANETYSATPSAAYVPVVSLAQQAQAILNRKTMERIQRAVIAGRTTWATPDVVAHCAWLDKIHAIAVGVDKTSTSLPVEVTFPVGT